MKEKRKGESKGRFREKKREARRKDSKIAQATRSIDKTMPNRATCFTSCDVPGSLVVYQCKDEIMEFLRHLENLSTVPTPRTKYNSKDKPQSLPLPRANQ